MKLMKLKLQDLSFSQAASRAQGGTLKMWSHGPICISKMILYSFSLNIPQNWYLFLFIIEN